MNEAEKIILEAMIKKIIKQEDLMVEEFEDPLAKVFLQPFVDVVDTARHGLEKTTAKAWNNIGNLAKHAAMVMIPGINLKDSIQASEQKLKARLGEIDSEYRDVIQRNYDMMKTRDLWGIAFFYNPALLVGSKYALKAPELALGTLEALTGGNPVIKTMKTRLQGLQQRVRGDRALSAGVDGAGWVGGGMGDDGGGDFGFESVIREQDAAAPPGPGADIPKNIADQINKAAMHPTVKAAIASSPLVAQMKAIASSVLIEQVQDALNFSTYDEMLAKHPKMKQQEAQMLQSLPEDATEEQIAQLKEAMLPEIKTNIKSMYIKQLQAMATQTPEIKQDLSATLQQINKL